MWRASAARWHNAAMLLFMPDRQAAEREEARWHPERETLLLAAAGAATVLGPPRCWGRATAPRRPLPRRAARTMDRVDLWRARQAMNTLSRERREVIAAAGDIVIQASRCVTLTR